MSGSSLRFNFSVDNMLTFVMYPVILEKGIIPANANFEKVNPKLDVDFYNTRVGDNLSRLDLPE